MATDLGRVSLIGKGEYSPTVQYERLDVVRYNGVAYLVLKDVKGVTPAAGANYMKLVEDGEQGAQGPAGTNGTNGTNGAQGPAGPGVASGGSAGQVLAKKSATNYDTYWIDPPEGGGDVDLSAYAPKESPVFTGSISLGRKDNTYVGYNSYAVGNSVTASENYSHAEGFSSVASAYCSHAEGNRSTASGEDSHAEGFASEASGKYSHAEGNQTIASGFASHAGGAMSEARGSYSFAQGETTIAGADGQAALGSNNKYSTNKTDRLIVGKGSNASDPANCFRVTDTGVYASGNYNASGADYAEMFEWADNNPEKQDRVGRFVTLDGAKIRLAGPEDDYILGIVSGNPSVVGDVHDDQWQGMYLYDIFGRPIWEDVEVPDVTDKDGRVIIPAHTEHRQKLNPNYDGSQLYQPRSKRPEWDAVGMLGKLVSIDDGSCEVNGWCTAGVDGIAVKSLSRTKYRVIERLDENHIRILIL